MYMQLAVLCLLAVSMVGANGYGVSCELQLCGQNLGVYYVTLTKSGGQPAYEVLTFHNDGFFNGIASNQNATFSSFEGTWKCTGKNNVVATDFLFNFATATSPAILSKGVFQLTLNGNNQVSGTLTATGYDLASTGNQNQSQWIQVSTISFNAQGYQLLKKCNN